MNVLVPVRWPVGGIRTFLRYSYGTWSADQVRPRFVCPGSVGAEALASHFHKSEARFTFIRSSITSLAVEILRESVSARPDVVHSQGLSAAIAAAPTCFVLGLPHVVTLHDIVTTEVAGSRRWQYLRPLVRRALSQACAIHCVSDDAADNLRQVLPGIEYSTRICSIRNGVDVELFSSSKRRAVRGEINASDECLLLGFFGRFMAPKGFRLLIAATDILRRKGFTTENVHICCVGTTGGFVREDEREIRRLGLSEYFSFLPFTPDVCESLRGMDAIVCPSRWEACGLVPMEAMCAGVPVIGTDCIGLKEVLSNTPAVVTPSGDADRLAGAIEKFDRNAAAKGAASFVAEARKRFDSRVASEKLLNLLCSCSQIS